MEFSQFFDALARRWPSVWAHCWAYLKLDTPRLVQEAEGGTAGKRWGFTACLFALPVVALFGWSVLLAPESALPMTLLAQAVLFSVAVTALPALPLLGVLWLRQRRIRLNLWLNLLIGQQFFVIMAVAATALIARSAEPARTDFELFLRGQGASTPLFEMVCGELEAGAELLSLARGLRQRSSDMTASTQEVASWGEPASFEDIEKRLEAMELSLQRHAESLRFQAHNIRRVTELSSKRLAAQEAFFEAYPSAVAALAILATALLAILLLSSAHVWRIVVGAEDSRRRQVVSAAVLAAGWLASGVLVLAVTQWQRQKPLSFKADGEFMEASRELDLRINQLRLQFGTLAPVCGSLNSHGLWDASAPSSSTAVRAELRPGTRR